MMRGRLSRWMAIWLLALLSGLPTVAAGETATVRVSDWRGPGEDDGRPDYFHDLFRRLMEDTAPRYGAVTVVTVPDKFSQGRLLAELKAGRIDVTWTGTNIEREREGHPVRIPIDMGLIGQRVPVIRARDAAAFAAVRGVADLKHFTACQGAQWPDADVLAAAGLPQVTNVYFDQLYAMLRAGRCDYFARGLAEVAGEIEIYGGTDLMVFDKLVVAYPMPVYFYVAPGLDMLARRLEEGLRAMLVSGELRRMLSTHPSTRGAFPLERFNDATIIRLPNPNLPPATPLSDSSLWLTVGRTGQGPS